MQFLSHNLVAIVVAFFTCALAWIYGGTRSDLLVSFVPWMVAITAELMLVFPQSRYGETSGEARTRAWKEMRRDPLVWVGLSFLVLLLIPFINVGLCPICDYPAIMSGASAEPPVKFMPFCVNVMQHYNVVGWFFSSVVMMIAVRHSLSKSGKKLLLEIIVWNGAVLALLGFVQQASGAPGPLWATLEDGRKAGDFFSTFGYPNMAGDYFTTLFALAIGIWRSHVAEVKEEKNRDDVSKRAGKIKIHFWKVNYHLIPAALFYFGALNTLSRAAIMLVTSLAIVFFFYTFISTLSKRSKATKVKRGVIAIAALAFAMFLASVFMPENMRREVNTLDATGVLDRVSGRGQYHARVATEIWKTYPLFGCGGWGYKHFCIPKMTAEELRHIQQTGGINVHNDYLQFLAEHGTVGFILIVALFVLALKPTVVVWKKLVNAARFAPKDKRPPSPIVIFSLPAGAFAALLAMVATMIHAFGDCPLRSPAVMSLFFIIPVAIDGYLPKLNKEEE